MKSGSVYKRNKSWCISYYVRGKRFRETVKDARSKRDAEAKLQQRLASFHANKFVGPAEDKICFEDLQQIIKDDYTRKKRASLVTISYHFKHLEPFFRWRRAIDIDVALVEVYQGKRQAEGAENATINRDVCTLQHSLKLAVKQKKLSTAPTFEKLPETNVRQGFLSFSDFDKIFAHVEEQWRRNTIEFVFLTGWRSGRVRGLLWSQIEDDLTEIRASADVTTKKAPGNLPLNGRLLEIVQEQAKLRRPDCPYVFHHNGRKIGNYRKAWYSACGKAGYGKILSHDFRRSLARNLSRRGVSIPTIMRRAGWKTLSTFTRYNVTDLSDQAEANNVIDQARTA